jgi:hypothetical protein
MDSLIAGSLLAAYYRPLVAALLEAQDDQATEDGATTIAQLPGIDLALGIPTFIVTIVRTLPSAGLVNADQLRAVGATLLEAVRNAVHRLARARWRGTEDHLSPSCHRDGA